MSKPQTVAVLRFLSESNGLVNLSTVGTKAAPSTRIVEWVIDWDDGNREAHTGQLPTNLFHTYKILASSYLVVFSIKDSRGSSSEVRLTVLVRGPIPIPTAIYGPQPDITCPLGAILIPTGSTTASRQTLINGNPTGTSFCIQSGLHTASGPNTPKSGNIFTGQYGAIIDGTGWVSSDNTDAFFKAHLQDIDSVTIKNLTLRNFPQRAIHTWHDFSDGWIIDYNEISTGQCGVSIPNSSFVRHNYIHHCNGPSSGGTIPNGAYIVSLAHDILFEDNHFSFCGDIQKVIDQTNNVTFRRNYIHNCLGAGVWYDGENTGMLIEDNVIDDCALGVIIEISAGVTIRRNTVRRTSDSGIFISTSRDADIYQNIVENCFRSINLFANCPAIGGAFDHDLRNNSIHENTITVPNTVGVLVDAISASDASCDATYTGGMGKNNTWLNNQYYVPSAIIGNSIWYIATGKTWAQWQAFGEDAGSILTPI